MRDCSSICCQRCTPHQEDEGAWSRALEIHSWLIVPRSLRATQVNTQAE